MQPFYFTIKEKCVLFSKHKQSISIYSMLINIFEYYKQWPKLHTWYQIVMTLFVQQISRDFKLYPRWYARAAGRWHLKGEVTPKRVPAE